MEHRLLDERQIETFETDGAVLIKSVFDHAWLDRLERHVEEVLPGARSMAGYEAGRNDGHERKPEDATRLVEAAWRTHGVARELALASPLAQIAAEGMRSETVHLYEDLLMCRRPGSATPTVWHQDTPLWPLAGEQMCSIWFSLEPMTPETGALRFVAGSHLGPNYFQYVPNADPDRMAADARFMPGGKLPDIEADEGAHRIVSFSTEPGDVILFHPKAIHPTYGSRSDQAKRSFSIRYMGDDVRWQPKENGAFQRWLRDVKLVEGDRLPPEVFPEVWPKRAA